METAMSAVMMTAIVYYSRNWVVDFGVFCQDFTSKDEEDGLLRTWCVPKDRYQACLLSIQIQSVHQLHVCQESTNNILTIPTQDRYR